MTKYAGWLLAAIIVMGVVVVEWRPWRTVKFTQPQEDQTVSSGIVSTPQLPKDSGTENADASLLPLLERPAIRAQLNPLNFTTVVAELGAKLQDFSFKEGESFKKGQELVRFDCAVQNAQLQRVRATLAIASRNAATNGRLLKLGTVSRVEAENSLSELDRAKAEVAELEAIASKCSIDAPFNGKVVEQRARGQQFVQVGQPLIDILDSSALELEFIAPSIWAPWLKPGHIFEITIDETGKTYPARVMRVGARIDSVSQTFKVAALVDGEFADLTPGMSGTIMLTPPESVDAGAFSSATPPKGALPSPISKQ